MKTLIIVQARMTSTRLPGKVMLPLAGVPMLGRLFERLRRVSKADGFMIATTGNQTDDVICDYCQQERVAVFRGSEHDVLARYALAADAHQAHTVVRITSDCPLIDPFLIDEAISQFEVGDTDYLSNMQPPTWPYGMAIEVMSVTALSQAHRSAKLHDEREHVTPYIYWHPESFRIKNWRNFEDLSHYRLTVDTPQDYELVRRVFEALYLVKKEFTLRDIIDLLKSHPDWLALNHDVKQKEVIKTMEHTQ